MPTVLIGSEPIRRQSGPFRTLLEGSGFSVIDPEVEGKLSEADLLRWLPASDAIIAGGETISAGVIAASPRLRAIARTGVGYDAVDVPAASARGVAVAITPGTNHEAVAEHTFGLLLALSKDLIGHDRGIRSGRWDRLALPRPLRGQTLGLVGLGRIGRAVAHRAQAFGMRIIASDPIQDPDFDRVRGIARVEFAELLGSSDVVSLHLPLVEATRGMFDRSAFARMKPGAVLINTSRGGLIVEEALIEALRSGQLAGAGLDVFDTEPPHAEHPLRSHPNVLATPHLAGIDALAMTEMALMAARNLVDLFEGRWPAHAVVNPEVAPAWGH